MSSEVSNFSHSEEMTTVYVSAIMILITSSAIDNEVALMLVTEITSTY